jgi:hypothetical protein
VTLAQSTLFSVVDVEKKAGTVFASEPLSACFDEAVPLMHANNAETGAYHVGEFSPNKEKLLAMENAGVLRVFTARKGGKLIGYQVFFTLFGINYPDVLNAVCHVTYVAPEYRGFTGAKFIYWVDEQLRKEGALEKAATPDKPLVQIT